MLPLLPGADTGPEPMPGHNADEIVAQVDWDEWPDFELFDDGDAESDAPEDEAAA